MTGSDQKVTPSEAKKQNGRVLAVQKISGDPRMPFVKGHIDSNNTWLMGIMDSYGFIVVHIDSMVHG